MPYKNPEKQREYQRKWVADQRAEWLNANGPCVVCGSTKELQVDHINRKNKVTHRVWSLCRKKRDKELAKCQVLCYPCHKAKSKKEEEPPHGSNGRYTSPNYRCRCDKCRKAHREVNAQYR